MADQSTLQPEKWVDEHGDYLYRYAFSRLKNTSAAEDAVQEALLAAFKSRERFSGEGSERAWLMGILKHKIVDYIRKAVRETQLEDMDEVSTTEESFVFKAFGLPPDRPARWQFNPRKVFEQREFWEVFEGCLKELNERLHAVFVLRELEGVSTEEICKQMAVTPNNLWVMIHRARSQLKGCLETNWLSRHL